MKTILLYTSDRQKAQSITELSDSLGITVREITQKELTYSVESLLGSAPKVSIGLLPFFYYQPEVMVISGLIDQELDYFLAKYKEKGIAPIPLKAVATPYNIKYSIYELTLELIKEHKTLQK